MPYTCILVLSCSLPACLLTEGICCLSTGKSGQLKAQAQVFQPKAQMLANKQVSAEDTKPGKQPEAAVSVAPVDDNPSKQKDQAKTPTKSAEASPAKQKEQQKEQQKEKKSIAASPAKSPSKISAQQVSGPVEDLDELHTLQVSQLQHLLMNCTAALERIHICACVASTSTHYSASNALLYDA